MTPTRIESMATYDDTVAACFRTRQLACHNPSSLADATDRLDSSSDPPTLLTHDKLPSHQGP